MNKTALRILVAGIALSVGSVMAAPLGTAFTYQGQLKDSGAPAGGAYDFEFKLFDAAAAGAQIGSTLLKGDVAVSAGLFTVSLDFGATPFAGQSRFLEIGVRPGASTGAYTLLGTRQELTPSPNALFATSAANATTVAGLTCATNQVAKWSGSAWTCGADTDTNSGGTVTSVAAGAGLSGGPITGTGTLTVATGGIASGMIANGAVGATQIANGAVGSAQIANGAVGSAQVNTAQVQARVTGACAPGSTVQGINADGTVTCAVTEALPGFAIGTLDSPGPGTAGQHSSITIGADGLGLISYYDATNADLKVAHCSDTACTTATTTTIDSAGVVGTHTSITIGADGLGLISYRGSSGLRVAHCANPACSSATTAALDVSIGPVSTSIAIGADGLGLISYAGATGLKVAHCNDVACSSATTATLDVSAVVGLSTSITIGLDGLGLVSYAVGGAATQRIAHCANVACSAATTPGAGGGNDTDHSSITIGTDGRYLVSYFDTASSDLKVVSYAYCEPIDCGAPPVPTTLDGLAIVVGQYTSITIGSDGLPIISYYDATNGDLKVAHCSNSDCSTATKVVVDGTGDVGQYSSITIGTDGFPLISYYNATNTSLKVAHCSNLLCQPNVRRR